MTIPLQSTSAGGCTVVNMNPKALAHEQVLSDLMSGMLPIDFRTKAGLNSGDKLAMKHYLVISVEEILRIAKANQLGMRRYNDQIFIYNGAYWDTIEEDRLKHFLGEASLILGVPEIDAKHYGFQDALFKQFAAAAYLNTKVKPMNEVLVNLQNGTFVISPASQALRRFDRDDFITYQLPFDFDPAANAPLFHAYLNQVLPDPDQQAILAECAGNVFVKRQTLKLEKSLMLYGSGANGKSVFFEILMALLGKHNVCSYPLRSLTDRSGYSRAMLGTKLLNYASEISSDMNTTIFKQLVSGEPVDARFIYGDPFIMEDYAKLIFNANELPKDVENNEAYFRRLIILKFDVTIPVKDRDPELAAKIIANELPGVFNWVLAGLRRLLVQKGFTQSAAAENAIKEYKESSDTIHLFLTDEGYQQSNSTLFPLQQVYMAYKKYCSDLNYKVNTYRAFSDRLKLMGYQSVRRNTGTLVYIEKKPF